MPKKLNIKVILRKNRRIDPSLLADTARLARKLRAFGQVGPTRQIASPLERKQATTLSSTLTEL